ncbi:hypothetical protein UCRPC4_g01071 [Phaeomoniella chlamydospora]|uniref:Uncharacterized protein n=1 Tax=Phaeomoniella chlamydospora TaxID=158046 RepID=A0A0G2EZI7_PHACM|nr:hypothetical protein UCRPC4_g01071 [Phaeomoniella chlamydospora]
MAAIVASIVPDTPDPSNKRLITRLSQTADTNPLSWPSAYWALVTIGLNTMCQPFGRVLKFPNEHSFALRSSPVIYVVDTLSTLLEIVGHAFEAGGLIEGVDLTVQARFAHVRADEDGSFGALRKNTVFRALLFLLGALPQAIKLYAIRGAPWTQTLATIYLVSFLCSEIITAIAHRDPVQQVPNTPNPGNATTYWITIMLTILAVSVGLIYVLFAATIFVIIRDYWTFAAWPLILSACLINSLYVCSVTSSKREVSILCSGPLVSVSGVSLSGASSLATTGLGISLSPTLCFLSADRQTTALLATVVILSTAITSISFYRLTRNISARYVKYMHFELSAYYFLLHLLTAFLGFAFLYDSTSTVKPAWTEFLG